MNPLVIVIIVVVVLLLGIVIFPLINRKQFRNLPYDQQIRILMQEAKGTAYFKNVSKGSTGTLYFVKNKRKILELPWVLRDGAMHCTRQSDFDTWDYPEEKTIITPDELTLIQTELEAYNKKSTVKFYISK